MKLFASLYLDEDVSILVADILQARGFDVITVRAEKMLGRSDSDQLKKRFLSSVVFLRITGCITKNFTVLQLKGVSSILELSSPHAATHMN